MEQDEEHVEALGDSFPEKRDSVWEERQNERVERQALNERS